MTAGLDRLHAELKGLGYVTHAVPDGLGIEFRDGCDAWWVLPGDPLSSVEVAPECAPDLEAIVRDFERLDELRARAIHAVRHHLARRRMSVDRVRSGSWPIQTQGGHVSSQVDVGAALTAALARAGDVVEAVRAVFAGSIVRKPIPKQVARDLATVGAPPDEPVGESRGDGRFSPMAILSMMGLCEAIDSCSRAADEGREATAEEMAEAARPKGRIGQALARFAAGLPHASASFCLGDNSMDVEFRDGMDCYQIRPKSRDLAGSISRDGPEAAGDQMLAEFRRLEVDRARVVTAFRAGLPRLGYRVQDERSTLHYGRDTREGRVDLAEALTEALRLGSAEDAIRGLMADRPALAESVLGALPAEAPESLPPETTKTLLPPRPKPVDPRAFGDIDVGGLDRIARTVIAEWFEHRDVLRAYFDPMLYAPASDTWASGDDWLAAARRFPGEDYWNTEAELIRLELGNTQDKAAWLQRLRSEGRHGEYATAEIVAVSRYRREMPEVAREWFVPERLEDCREVRARAEQGDWIAARHLAAFLNPGDEGAWHTLSILKPEAIRVFFGAEAVAQWRAQASREVEGTWDWSAADGDLLKAAVVHGWGEVGEAMMRNPYLIHALLHDESALTFAAGPVALACSLLAPSGRLARLVGALLSQDFPGRFYGLARQAVGAADKDLPDFASRVADRRAMERRGALAIAWSRCRPWID